MGMSLYHSATGSQAPHCIHAIGIGKTGAYMVEALMRTGEIEDMLEDPRARFTALAVDIGDQDMHELKEYGRGLGQRLAERNIPTERAQVRTVALDVPDREDLMTSLNRWREYLKMEYPRYYWNPNYEPWLPSDVDMPKAGDSFPRAVSKAIYGHYYYGEDKTLESELNAFVDSINATKLPSIVLVFFSMAGGTGSGMVVDLARHLSNVKLGRRIPVVGVAAMPFSGDEEHAGGKAALFPTMNEIDCMLDDAKNQGVMAVWGDLYKNPFTGGFFALPQEHSWQRLSSYTKTGQPAIRDALRKGVTRKFVDDSFARFIVQDYGRLLFKLLRPAGFTGAPHERNISGDRTWTVFDVAKFTHPGVEVLPGEPRSKWREVVSKWIGYIPQWSGLKEGFKTDYIEVNAVAPRELWNDTLQKKLEDTLGTLLLPGEDGSLHTMHGEFFDELTSYANVVIPGVAKTDFTAFYEARDAYDQIEDWDAKLLMHSWLLDLGVMLSEQSIRFDGMAGECIWGCACWVVVPHDAIRGDAVGSLDITAVQAEHIAPMVKTV
ncbi:MAG TPA: tubulin-like doman-containing protein, partial [Mycobacteriales bacterium]